MKRRPFARCSVAALAAVAASALVLSGCSGGGSGSGDEKVTLAFMRTGTPEQLRPLFEPMIEEFEKQNPNITIDMQDLGWADATSSIGVMAGSKTLPDVMYHLPGQVFELAEQGLVLDVSDRMSDELRDDIYPVLLESGQYQGKQYLVPSAATPLLLWYSVDLFEKAGLDPDNPPSTWEEYLDAAAAIEKATGVPGSGMYSKPAGGETSFMFESLYASEVGGPSWDADAQKYTYDEASNADAAVNALQFMKDMTKNAQPNLVEYDRFTTRTLLRDGKVGMALDGINMVGQVKDQVDSGDIRVAAMPAGASGESISAINVGGWFIPSSSEHPDEAWKFLEFLMSTGNQTTHSSYGSVPVLKSETAQYEGQYWDVLTEALLSGVPEGISPKTGSLWTTNGEQLQALLTTKQPASKTLENIVEEHSAEY